MYALWQYVMVFHKNDFGSATLTAFAFIVFIFVAGFFVSLAPKQYDGNPFTNRIEPISNEQLNSGLDFYCHFVAVTVVSWISATLSMGLLIIVPATMMFWLSSLKDKDNTPEVL